MSREEEYGNGLIALAFKKACQYLQKNPPSSFLDWESGDELAACLGANTYEDGWMQWANYFADQALKEVIEKENEEWDKNS